MTLIKKFMTNESGATAIEYGLIAALIAVAAVVAMTGVGNQLRATFEGIRVDLIAANNT
jgi:pilus assembly protein Flp/PilA